MKSLPFHRHCATLRWLAAAAACCALLSIGTAASQSDPALSFRRLTIQDGLPAVEVMCVLEDSRGFLWFGTRDGLVRYDSREMRVFRPEAGNPHSLGDRHVNDLKEDSQDNLWVATENGLDFWDRATEQFVHFQWNPTNTASLSHNVCRRLLLDPDGSIWVGTAAGLNRFNPRTGKWERFLPERGRLDHISDWGICCLLRDRKGVLWIGTEDGGLNQMDPQTGRFRVYTPDPNDPRSLSHRRVTSLAEDADGGLWIGTEDGLCRLDPERRFFERFGFEANGSGALPARMVPAVLVDRAGQVWVGMDGGGLSRFDPGSRRFVHHRHSRYDVSTLASDVIFTLYEDRHGDLWAGHFPAGVSHANRLATPFQVFRSLPGDTNSLSDDHVLAFWEDPSGDLWVGTDNGGLNQWTAATGKWKAYRHDPGNARSVGGKAVVTMLRDQRGNLWVGAFDGGLNRFEPDTGTFGRYLPDATRSNALSNPHVWNLLEDRQGQLWAATFGGGLERYVPEEDGFAHHRHVPEDPQSFLNDIVLSLLEDRAGYLWAGTSTGLTRRDPATGRWQRWPDTTGPVEALSRYWIYDLLEDREGAIWASTEGAGLWRLDPRTGRVDGLRMADGLPSDVIRAILEDDDGMLWVASNNGLARVDPRTRQIRTFDDYNGAPSRLFSPHGRLRLRSGELVFGTTQGFVKFQPRAIQSNTNPPPVVFTGLEVFNQWVVPGAPGSPLRESLTETRRLEIPARLSMLTFHFAVLNYRSPQLNRCLYQLEGFDKDWRDPGSDLRAIYTNLDPGRYRLRVKAANNDGVWNETGASLELIIVPPWWRTWWFRSALALVALASAVGIGGAISTRRTRAKLIEMERERQLAREREQAQQEREKLQSQLTQAQKMESVGRLAGGVAHDFNNMLQAILGNAAIALQDLPADSPLRESLEEIEKSAQRSADLTRQLLAFARKQTIAPKVLDLNDTVAGMLKMLRRLIGEDIDLAWRPGADLWPIKMDPSQIDQVLANLCVNARDAIEGVGTVTIETGNTTLDDTYAATHPEAVAGDYVLLIVSDTGKGMDAETRSHLFEPFFTTKEKGKGTGLGLATVFGIVKQNHGLISVYSEPGQGSTFKICLPRAEAGILATATAAAWKGDLRGTETVLLVEDEDQILNLAQRILCQYGYTVLAARSPEAALKLAEQHSGRIHLLITDVVMPGMNGRELRKRLVALQPELRCLYMSGYTADVIAHHGVLDEGVQFLQKPFSIESFAERVREALKQPLET
jgi:two-component system, sensor histidine kinase ChiS